MGVRSCCNRLKSDENRDFKPPQRNCAATQSIIVPKQRTQLCHVAIHGRQCGRPSNRSAAHWRTTTRSTASPCTRRLCTCYWRSETTHGRPFATPATVQCGMDECAALQRCTDSVHGPYRQRAYQLLPFIRFAMHHRLRPALVAEPACQHVPNLLHRHRSHGSIVFRLHYLRLHPPNCENAGSSLRARHRGCPSPQEIRRIECRHQCATPCPVAQWSSLGGCQLGP